MFHIDITVEELRFMAREREDQPTGTMDLHLYANQGTGGYHYIKDVTFCDV